MSGPNLGFWLSRKGLAALALVAAAGYFLLTEHHQHVLALLPYLILLACPLMHLLMHHDHGHGHSGKQDKEDEDHERSRRGGQVQFGFCAGLIPTKQLGGSGGDRRHRQGSVRHQRSVLVRV